MFCSAKCMFSIHVESISSIKPNVDIDSVAWNEHMSYNMILY